MPHRQKFRYDLIYVKKILRTSAQDRAARPGLQTRQRLRSAVFMLKGDLGLLSLDAGLVLRSLWNRPAGSVGSLTPLRELFG